MVPLVLAGCSSSPPAGPSVAGTPASPGVATTAAVAAVTVAGDQLADPSRDPLATDPTSITVERVSGNDTQAQLRVTMTTSTGDTDSVTTACTVPCLIEGPSPGTAVSVWPRTATWHSVSSPTTNAGFAAGTDAQLPGTELTVVAQGFTPRQPDMDSLVLRYRDADGIWDQHRKPVAFDSTTVPDVTVLASDSLSIMGAIIGSTSVVASNDIGGLTITDRSGTKNTVTVIALPKGSIAVAFDFVKGATRTAGGLAKLAATTDDHWLWPAAMTPQARGSFGHTGTRTQTDRPSG